ncbi:YcnI family protein [soil metagenome]
MSRTLRAAVLALGVLITSMALSGVASAHVTVNSADATQGGFGVLNFRVPNESDTAGTVGLRVQLPENTPFAFVSTTPIPGWTASLTRVTLDQPIESEGQQITEAVSIVTWTAQPGTRIDPDEYLEFSLSVGPFPDVELLEFKAIQTYDDGTEVAWIEETVEGQAEQGHPAPVLSLPPGSEGTGHGASEDAGAPSNQPSQGSTSVGPVSGLAITALVVGTAGLIAGLLGLWFGLSARRRTVR